jgi:hypothetical protein
VIAGKCEVMINEKQLPQCSLVRPPNATKA